MTSCSRCGRTFADPIRFCPNDGAEVFAAAEDNNIGRVLKGDFEILEPCGKGAMGTVYRTYQRSMDRVVAVKILRGELVGEAAILRRFLRESRAIARLQHPNIVTVHLTGETEEGTPFLVMEFIDGVSLEAMCEGRALPVAQSVAIGKQIAAALAEAHDHGIIHRDLKPANILVTELSGGGQLVKVVDFGIAKLLHGDQADRTVLTQDGTIFGTPHYIAPEQATGGNIDHRIDVYALGVILFRLLTGRLPFEGGLGMQVVLKHLRDPVPHPNQFAAGVPAWLDELVVRCMAKEPGGRPATAEQLLRELGAAEVPPATESSLSAVTGTLPSVEITAAETASSRPTKVLAGVAIAIGVGISIGVLSASWLRGSVAPSRAAEAATAPGATGFAASPPVVKPRSLAVTGAMESKLPTRPDAGPVVDAAIPPRPRPLEAGAAAPPVSVGAPPVPATKHRHGPLPITVIETPTTEVLPQKIVSPVAPPPSLAPPLLPPTAPAAPKEEEPARPTDPTNLPPP